MSYDLKALVKFSLVAASLSLVPAAMADHGGPHRKKLGMAGCGFGSTLIKSKKKWPQFGAAILNGLGGNQTFGITSGTSNCVAPRSRMANNDQKVFMENNLASISKEAAKGQGETLAALAEVFGCPQQEFFALSKSQYNDIFAEYDADAVLTQYRSKLSGSEALGNQCANLSAS